MNPMPARPFVTTLALALIVTAARAQAPAVGLPPPPPPPPPEAAAPASATLDQQIDLLQKRVALQEDKVRTITADMVAIDANVEREVTALVAQLNSVTDSTDSDTKVVNQKKETIEALKKSIDYYRKLRQERASQLLHPTYINVSDAELEGDIARLDERVEQRVDQILAVTASMAQNTDYAGYDSAVRDEYGRTVGVNREVRQAERSNQRSDNAKDRVAEGLQKDQARLEAENTRLTQQLALTRDPDTVEYLKESIAWNQEQIGRRDAQMAYMNSATAPAQQEITRKAANQLGDQFEETRLDFKASYQKLLALKSRRDQERTQLKVLTDKLARLTAASAAQPPAPAPAAP